VTAATTAAAAAILCSSSSSSSSSKSEQALPLTAFASSMPSGEEIVLALAEFTQLTQLELRLSDRAVTGRAMSALASLTSLKELVLGQDSLERRRIRAWHHDHGAVEMNHSLDALHPALQSLTCLTNCTFGGVPAQA
jgi:hypothetical protein